LGGERGSFPAAATAPPSTGHGTSRMQARSSPQSKSSKTGPKLTQSSGARKYTFVHLCWEQRHRDQMVRRLIRAAASSNRINDQTPLTFPTSIPTSMSISGPCTIAVRPHGNCESTQKDNADVQLQDKIRGCLKQRSNCPLPNSCLTCMRRDPRPTENILLRPRTHACNHKSMGSVAPLGLSP
jgi:hypothetical protein